MTQLGKYELHEQLGKGGFGTVYRATDNIGRDVAIKVLKSGLIDDQEAVNRFRREALAAGSLFHPHIATILELNEDEGRIYLVERYVAGKPLDQVLNERVRLPCEEALGILKQVVEALDYAHSRGFVHRDIKPGNIIISPTDGAVLTDFGLVKAATTSGLSTTGAIMGTPAYIAPEIWSGKPATPATDVYALACVFYEMVTGVVLYEGKSTPQLMKKHFEPVRFPANLPIDIPKGVLQILKKALDVNPQRRYQSTSAFLQGLLTLSAQSGKKSAPSRWIWFLLIFFVIFGAFSYFFLLNKPPIPHPLPSQQPSATHMVIMTAIPTVEIPTISATETTTITSTNIPTKAPISTSIPPTAIPSFTPKPVLFEDDFSNGLSTGWSVLSGEPMVVNNCLTSIGPSWLMIGDSSWKNYMITLKAETHECWMYDGNGGDTRRSAIGVRVQNSTTMIAYEWANCEQRMSFVKNGVWNDIPNAIVSDDEFQVLRNIVITVIDNQITVVVDNVQRSTISNTLYDSGGVILVIPDGGIVNDFKVVALP